MFFKLSYLSSNLAQNRGYLTRPWCKIELITNSFGNKVYVFRGGLYPPHDSCSLYYTLFRLPFFPFLLPSKCVSLWSKFVKGLVFKETGLMLCGLLLWSVKLMKDQKCYKCCPYMRRKPSDIFVINGVLK